MIPQRSYSVDVTGALRLNAHTAQWCQLPYPDHPNGCPQYGQRDCCPPQAPSIDDFIDLARQHWFLITEFDLAQYLKTMAEKHPDWTPKRLRCLLYWQGSIRKEQRDNIAVFHTEHTGTAHTLLPEAMGVNVLATLTHVGIEVEKHPETKILKVALVGYTH